MNTKFFLTSVLFLCLASSIVNSQVDTSGVDHVQLYKKGVAHSVYFDSTTVEDIYKKFGTTKRKIVCFKWGKGLYNKSEVLCYKNDGITLIFRDNSHPSSKKDIKQKKCTLSEIILSDPSTFSLTGDDCFGKPKKYVDEKFSFIPNGASRKLKHEVSYYYRTVNALAKFEVIEDGDTKLKELHIIEDVDRLE